MKILFLFAFIFFSTAAVIYAESTKEILKTDNNNLKENSPQNLENDKYSYKNSTNSVTEKNNKKERQKQTQKDELELGGIMLNIDAIRHILP